MGKQPPHHTAAAAASGTRTASARRRGRAATHSHEELLGLVAAVAQAAVTAGRADSPTVVSMPVFNRQRADADRVRGLQDPARDPERTPTAQAIQMRFAKLAERPVSWSELLAGAARTGRDQTMWLAALRRDTRRDELDDPVVIHALALIAARITPRALTQRAYEQTRELMLDAERAHDGQDGVLAAILPTANQILAHCGLRWENALALAGLRRAAPPKSRRARPPAPQPPGLPVAQAIAIYATLNGTWPSRPALMQFAARTGFALASHSSAAGPAR
jgi:hypothetical protein